jgi:NAD(P)-dependent dehydrogenase (short-subunit alcohol dehydrogenase family)
MSDQVWFVTGSSRGLGRAVVQEALAAGNRVVATARSIDSFVDLSATYGERILPVQLDVTDQVQAQAAVQRAVDVFGRIDVVVNNAGYANLIPIAQLTLDEIRSQMDAAFFGTVYVTMAALAFFRGQGGGHFIQVTSTGGRLTAPGVGAYQAAKHAVEGFSGVLNDEMKSLGIKVTMIEPGLMRTEWSGSSMEIPAMEPEFEATVGEMGRRLRAAVGKEPIDPAKVARALVDIAQMDAPPLHLLMGSDAVDMIARSMQALMDDDARWAELSRSVDFDSSHERDVSA